ncbi:MAG TPA: glycosyltransferase family 4 protein [Thermoanaerobaculia bacterium]|nr:glycosyltransferase family 4 protein [Thermoanaerobaculia bacterium]
MSAPRVAVLGVQTPFAEGGAERHVARLTEELRSRGVEADLVTMPLVERERFDLVRGALAWRGLDLSEAGGRPVDAVIATRFPSYAIRHPNKVVWLIHQYRQVYDQYGTPYSDFTVSPEDRRTREVVARIDQVGLTEARKIFANSATVAARLSKHNRIASRPLYHPPPLVGRYRQGPFGDHALLVGRLDAWKRADLAVSALAHAPAARLVIVGRGPEEARLRRLVGETGVAERVRWIARASDEELLELYATARIVVVPPAGEDLGYVPLEAFLSGKPVLTTEDAGGPLEFVENGVSGLVVAPRPESIGAALRVAWEDTAALAEMGERGRRRVSLLSWDAVVEELLGAAGLRLP